MTRETLLMSRPEISTPDRAYELEQLIAAHASIVDFGSPSTAPGDDWIARAESALERPLPASYRWFLQRYGGGEIGGEEIYSIYGIPFETANGGDIVSQHLANRKTGLLGESKLVVGATDFVEIFFFDYDAFRDGECPVDLRLPSGEQVRYAEDFYDFLRKRIAAHLA